MKSNEKTIEEMRQAIVTYTGPVTRYPPGKARAPAKSVVKKKYVRQLREADPGQDGCAQANADFARAAVTDCRTQCRDQSATG
jgi:hypothetical protein